MGFRWARAHWAPALEDSSFRVSGRTNWGLAVFGRRQCMGACFAFKLIDIKPMYREFVREVCFGHILENCPKRVFRTYFFSAGGGLRELGGPDAFQGVGLSFSSTVWAFEFVDFSAFSCQASGLATLGRPDLGRRRGKADSRRFSSGAFCRDILCWFRFAVARILVGDGEAR